MHISDLFIIRPVPRLAGTRSGAARDAAVPAAALAPAAGVFLTPQALTSFPVASGIISALWALAKQQFSWGGAKWVPLALSLVIGFCIFLITTSDESAKPSSTRGWIVSLLVALINCLMLCASALGILATISPD
jgi:hypothetical protein